MPIFGSVCFGIIQYDPLQEIKFNNDKNVIHIYLPAINDTFFERFSYKVNTREYVEIR